MKKAIFYATSAAMAASMSLAAPAAAQSGGNSEFAKAVVEFCSMFGNDVTGETGLPNKGGCISSFTTSGPVSFCKSIKDFGLLEIFGFRTQGECIVALS